MTTIIVIVVVALVFFVTICVVTFMVWKREAEMRTDSIKAIEQNLEEMLNELSEGGQPRRRAGSPMEQDGSTEQIVQQMMDDRIREKARKTNRRKSADPFGWMRAQNTSDKDHKIEDDNDLLEQDVFEEDRGERSPEISTARVMDSHEAEEIIFRAFERLKEETDRKYAEAEETYEAFLNSNAERLDLMTGQGLDQSWQSKLEPEPEQDPETIRDDDPIKEAEVSLEPAEQQARQEVETIQQDVTWEETPVGSEALRDQSESPEMRDQSEPPEMPEQPEQQDRQEQPEQQDRQEQAEPPEQNEAAVQTIDELIGQLPEETPQYEISFDFMDDEESDFDQDLRQPMGYDIGRSGKKYTASELEALIKE